MRKQWRVLIGAAILTLVGVAAYFMQKRLGPITNFQPANPVGLGQPKTFGKTDFKKNLFVQHGAMAVDDGPLTAIPCSPDPEPFATIQIEDALEGNLSCVEDYLGGVKLTYSVDGEIRTAGVAQRDSDGGDDWDARSYILRDKNGHLIIQTETASSGEEVDEKNVKTAAIACTKAVSAQVWDPQSKNFVPGPPLDDAPSISFRPPINVAKDCLNPDGSWKGN